MVSQPEDPSNFLLEQLRDIPRVPEEEVIDLGQVYNEESAIQTLNNILFFKKGLFISFEYLLKEHYLCNIKFSLI